WARIGVVTRELWSKESQWHNRKYFEVGSIKPSQLSPLARKWAAAFQSSLVPPQGTTGHGTGGVRTAIESPTLPDHSSPAARLVLAEKCRKPPECHRNFTVADLPPPATIFVDPGTRDQTGPQERPSGGLACTRHPPPGHLDFRAFWFKSVGVSFGIEQNIGETLPKFR
ncbi:2-oxoglutarate and Fe(II)-dependent oxygenase superfamily protein, partial [Prunus dulcis]